MQVEEIALRVVYSFLHEPGRLALRTCSQIHAQLPVRCEFSNSIWDLTLRIQGGPCGAFCDVPKGVCKHCYKFSCRAHTFHVLPVEAFALLAAAGSFSPAHLARLYIRRTLCLRCQVHEGFLDADQLARWGRISPGHSPFAWPKLQ